MGAGSGLVLIILGVLNIVLGQFVAGLWYALIGMFLRSGARASYQQLVVRRALQGVPVKGLMTEKVVTVSPSLTLAEVVRDYFMKHRFHAYPVLEDGELRGMVNLHDVKRFDEPEWRDRRNTVRPGICRD